MRYRVRWKMSDAQGVLEDYEFISETQAEAQTVLDDIVVKGTERAELINNVVEEIE